MTLETDRYIQEHGIVWGTTSGPTTAGNKINLGGFIAPTRLFQGIRTFTNNVTDYAILPTFAEDLSRGFHFKFRITWSSLLGTSRIFWAGNSAGVNEISISKDSDSGLKFTVYNGTTKLGDIVVPNAFALNIYNDWIISVDGTSVTIYKDNVMQSTTSGTTTTLPSGVSWTTAGAFSQAPANPDPALPRSQVYVGKSAYSADNWLNATVDYIDFYSMPYIVNAMSVDKTVWSPVVSTTTFDGSNFINCGPVSYDFNRSWQIKVRATFNDPVAPNMRIFDFGNGEQDSQIALYVSGSNQMKFEYYTASAGYTTSYTWPNTVSSGTSDEWVISYDSVWRKFRFYKNAEYSGTISPATPPNNIIRTNGYIGKSQTTTDPLFKGSIDYLHVFRNPYEVTFSPLQSLGYAYADKISNLSPSTLYYLRSYTKTSYGTTYGNQVTFTMQSGLANLATDGATPIDSNNAVAIGTVSSISSITITSTTDTGFVWDTSPNPATSLSTKVSVGTVATGGKFSANLTGLGEGIQYYIRSYAVTEFGTSYGPQVVITTPGVIQDYGHVYGTSSVPTTTTGTKVSKGSWQRTATSTLLSTPTIYTGSNPTTLSAVNFDYSNGFVFRFFGNWSTLNGSKIFDIGNGPGTDSIALSQQGSTNTLQFVAYNSTTKVIDVTLPQSISRIDYPLTKPAEWIVSIDNSLALRMYYNGDLVLTATNGMNGNMITALPRNINRTNVYVGKSEWTADPAFSGYVGFLEFYNKPWHIVSAFTFSGVASPMASNTAYYIRSYATTKYGTVYGNQVTTTTLSGLATVTSGNPTSVMDYSTTVSGSIVASNQNFTIQDTGFVWDISPNPTTAVSTKTSLGPRNTGDTFNYTITGLSPATLYYVRPYVITQYGTSYGPQKFFTTHVNVVDHGFVWNTSPTPTILNNKASLGSKTYSQLSGFTGVQYTSALSGLPNNSLIYVRSFITTQFGTTYGSQTTFTTLSGLASLSTSSATAIANNTATLNGSLDNLNGAASVTAHGFVWDLSPNPTVALVTKNDFGSAISTESMSYLASGLQGGKLYYVRSYAVTQFGTTYGLQKFFTTKLSIVAYGHCWSLTNALPTVADSKTNLGTQSSGFVGVNGNFSSTLTGLTNGQSYYVRSYVTTEVGTTYGSSAFMVTPSAVTESGFVWSSTHNPPTIADNIWSGGPTSFTILTRTITELTGNTMYYIRPYAKTGAGTWYGPVATQSTLSGIAVLNATTLSGTMGTTTNAASAVTNFNGGTVSQYGHVWGTISGATVAGVTKTQLGAMASPSTFTSNITGLTYNTLYYIRSYATTEFGTAYGAETTVTTLNGLATVTNSAVTSISGTTAVANGNITAYNGANAIDYGHAYSTSPGVTLANALAYSGFGARSTTGVFTTNLSYLDYNTTYYVNSYVRTPAGITYGTEVSFITLNGLATVTIKATSSINAEDVYTGGTATLNGADLIQYGSVWSTSTGPTVALVTKTELGSSPGNKNWSSWIPNLSASTTYYIRTYATTVAGTTYSNELSFTTQSGIPTLAGTTISNVQGTSASGALTVQTTGGSLVTAYGLVWGTTTGPTVALPTKFSLGSLFSEQTNINTSGNINSLAYNTTYYVRAYATTKFGTGYGTDASFITRTGLATVTTSEVSVAPSVPVAFDGNVTALDGENVTQHGHVWDISTAPTIALGSKTELGTKSVTGTFHSNPTGLQPTTTYYTRAYATTPAGTSYGNQVSFTTTKGDQPPAIVPVASSITGTTMVWTSNAGAMIVCNGVTQVSGSMWTGLSPNVSYTAYAYLPEANTLFQGPNSAVASARTLIVLPTITLDASIRNTQNGLVFSGNATSLGGVNLTDYGFCWNTSPNPTVNNSKTSLGSRTETGAFTTTVLGFVDGITYYFRGYGVNSAGTAYSNELSYAYIAGIRVASLTNSGDLRIIGELIEIDNHFHIDKDGKVRAVEFIEDPSLMVAMKTTSDGKLRIKGQLKEGEIL